MSKELRLLVIVGVLAGASVSYAQTGSLESPSVAEEMAGVNRSLDRLVSLLGTVIEQQKTDLLLRRIEMKERRVLPLEKEMRSLRNDVANITVEIDRMQAMIDEAESSRRTAEREGREQESKDLEQMIARLRLDYNVEVASRDDSERRARDLEDQIALQRRQIRLLDDRLMDLIDE